MNRALSLPIALVLLLAMTLPSAVAETRVAAKPLLRLAPKVALACSGTGKSEFFSRDHKIKNTSGFTLRSGRVIYWSSSDGAKGEHKLTQDLPENQSISVVVGGTTKGYTCSSHFLPGPPDLGAAKVERKSPSAVLVWIANFNPWVAAPSSKLRVRAMKCGGTVLREAIVEAPALAPRDAKYVSVELPNGSADYLLATVNVDGAVPDPNPLNDEAESADKKRCPPE